MLVDGVVLASIHLAQEAEHEAVDREVFIPAQRRLSVEALLKA